LAEVHRCGLIHRDIKPSNIVVDEHGGARLTDFGLASFVDEESSLTESGMVVGTPAYMSPEQASGQKAIDARSDIYSLGATLYECFTETKPFRGQSHEVIRQIRESEPTRPSLINERIPRPLEAICLKAMSKSPSNRYATVDLLINDLQRWQQGKRVTARLPGIGQRAIKWIRKDPKFFLAMATVAGTCLIGVGVSGYYWSRSVQQSRLAESRFDASLQTINTLADLTSESLNGDPGLASIRKQIQVMADKAFEPLVGQRPSDAQGLIRYLKAMDNLGIIKHSVAGPADALAFRKRMLDENRSTLASMRSDDELRRQWARMLQRLAAGHVEMRTYEDAINALNEAEALLSESDMNDRLLLGTIAHSRGTIHKWVNNDHNKAIEELNNAIELLDSYCKAFPDDLLAIAQRNNSLGWLADCELQSGNIESSEKHFQEVWAHYSKLADASSSTYLQRLEKLRAAKALLGLMVSRGDCDEAFRWDQEVGPEIIRLQASNPTLMEPAALKNSWGCDLLLAEILHGDLESAKTRADQLLADAKVLLQQFPNATRTWQVHGFAKQNWMIACTHVADYDALIPFIDGWINDVEKEIEQGLNVGFNQQFKLGLIFNLALVLDWRGDTERASNEWAKLMTIAPVSMKPGFQLMSQMERYRRARQEDMPFEFLLDEDFEESVLAAIRFFSAGGPYPTVKHSIAECHAVALDVLKRTLPNNEVNAQKIADHRSAAEKSLRTAHAAGFYNFGERLLKMQRDRLFEEEIFQAVFAE
jgi:tetratricopeptide (TPR) repeat protein